MTPTAAKQLVIHSLAQANKLMSVYVYAGDSVRWLNICVCAHTRNDSTKHPKVPPVWHFSPSGLILSRVIKAFYRLNHRN